MGSLLNIFMSFRAKSRNLKDHPLKDPSTTRTRTCTALLGMTILFSLCLCLPYPAWSIGLKENSIITDNTIKLGDIFYDLPRDAERVLGNAPRPGDEMVLNARTLLRVAMALDLPWRPSSNLDQVVLKRDATVIKYDQIKEELYTALHNEGIYGEYEIEIPGQHHEIILPHDQPEKMVITEFSIDHTRKKFEAKIVAPSRENPIQQRYIKGKMHPVMTVPVLEENIQHGHIISSRNIGYIKLKERDFTKDTIADAQKLIGMTARRVLIAGRPIKASDIIAPQIIERGSLVTLSLRDGIMNLTTQVKSLQNGAKGDIIRVVNTASNRTLQAVVIGENEVAVLQN